MKTKQSITWGRSACLAVLLSGCVSLGLTAAPATGQEMGRDEIKSRIDAAIGGKKPTGPRTRGLNLNDNREVNQPLYPAPPPPPPTPATPAEAKAQAEAAKPVTSFQSIQFGFGSANITQSSTATLREMAYVLGDPEYEGRHFFLIGHTDAVGSRQANQLLSERRAESVVDFLVRQGVPRARLRPIGMGEDDPRLPEAPNDGANRRVELRVLAN